jgi:GNAT superfamily N-acetyltransferase
MSTLTEDRVTLPDGRNIVVRPLASGDEAAITSWFAGLGPETRQARFLAAVNRLDSRTRGELAAVDHRDREAITAVAPDGATVAIARYVRGPGHDSAEVAVAVADRWRGCGIAGLLLAQLAARAHAAGIETFTALCLSSNDAVVHVLRRLGPTTVGPPSGGVVDVRIRLGR